MNDPNVDHFGALFGNDAGTTGNEAPQSGVNSSVKNAAEREAGRSICNNRISQY